MKFLPIHLDQERNAGIFCHNNPWISIAETVVGRGDRAWQVYTRTCPAYIEDISYWIPDIAKTRNLIAQNMGITLNETAQKDTESTIKAYEKSLPKGLKMGDITTENAFKRRKIFNSKR